MAERAWHEQGLRDAALAGDAVAWRALIDNHADSVRRYLAWWLGGRLDQIDDLAQESWLIAARSLGQIASERGAFQHWLFGIAGNVCRNHLRSRQGLATSEQKWDMMMGKGNKPAADYVNTLPAYYGQFRFSEQLDKSTQSIENNPPSRYYQWLTPGTIHVNIDVMAAGVKDQLKSGLEKQVSIEKQTNIDLEQVFKTVTEGAGLKLRVKLPVTENKNLYKDVTRIDLEANEYSLHT